VSFFLANSRRDTVPRKMFENLCKFFNLAVMASSRTADDLHLVMVGKVGEKLRGQAALRLVGRP